MPRLPLAFFTAAPLYGLAGMIWGIIMGASGDHSMFPAHAHLNLLGMVLMAIMGTFYALAGGRAGGKLGWAAFGLLNLGVVIMIPTLAKILQSTEDQLKPLIPIISVSELLIVAALLCFIVSVLGLWRSAPAQQA